MVAQAVTEKFPAAAGLSILATDADSSCLRRAQEGRYPESSLREVPENFRERWFTRAPGRRARRIDSLLGGPICWQVHELLNEPPQGVFQLILLRNNLLTYYRGLRMKNAFDRILSRLAPGGALIVGSHEQHPPPDTRPIVRDPRCPWVYWG
jgi:chemotaxis protein methyltransferase CheR